METSNIYGGGGKKRQEYKGNRIHQEVKSKTKRWTNGTSKCAINDRTKKVFKLMKYKCHKNKDMSDCRVSTET